MKVLLIEDDSQTAQYVIKGLKEKGTEVDHAATGEEGLRLGTEMTYDVLIIDRMLPKLDGLSLLKKLREINVLTPALFLSALGSTDDRVEGLYAGADDYLIKPFSLTELYARIVSLSRRPPIANKTTILKVADLEVNLLNRTVTRAGKNIFLHPTEFRLLTYLMQHAGQVVTRTMLLEAVWDFHFDPKTSIVETHVSRLRQKIDKDFDRELISTVRGQGYKIDAFNGC